MVSAKPFSLLVSLLDSTLLQVFIELQVVLVECLIVTSQAQDYFKHETHSPD
jgi:hypothetical protein